MKTAREQADQVALAVDALEEDKAYANPYVGRLSPLPEAVGIQFNPIAKPLSNTFYKNAIASGSIVPPQGEGAAVRRSDWLTGVCVLCFVALGCGAFVLAMMWR